MKKRSHYDFTNQMDEATEAALFRAKLKTQKEEEKIGSPLVSYSELDQRVCRVCDVVLKSEIQWDAHQASPKHIEAMNNFKSNAAQLEDVDNAKPESSVRTAIATRWPMPSEAGPSTSSKRRKCELDPGSHRQGDESQLLDLQQLRLEMLGLEEAIEEKKEESSALEKELQLLKAANTQAQIDRFREKNERLVQRLAQLETQLRKEQDAFEKDRRRQMRQWVRLSAENDHLLFIMQTMGDQFDIIRREAQELLELWNQDDVIKEGDEMFLNRITNFLEMVCRLGRVQIPQRARKKEKADKKEEDHPKEDEEEYEEDNGYELEEEDYEENPEEEEDDPE